MGLARVDIERLSDVLENQMDGIFIRRLVGKGIGGLEGVFYL